MTPFTRNLFLSLALFGLLTLVVMGLMAESNAFEQETRRIATATAWVTATANTQMSYALSSNLAQRGVELYEHNPRVALLLALEALYRRQPGYDLPYPTQHAIMQVLTVGTRVELNERDDLPELRIDNLSRNGRWHLVLDPITQDVLLHDLNTPPPQMTHPLLWGPQAVVITAFSLDSRWLGIARQEKVAYIWNLEREKPVAFQLNGHTFDVTALAFSPDGQWVATSSVDHSVRLWSLRDGKPAERPYVLQQHDDANNWLDREGHLAQVNTLAFSPDSHWLATGSNDHTIRLWDLQAADVPHWPILLTGPNEGIERLSFTPDGMQLYATSRRITHVWNVDLPSLISRACDVTTGQFTDWEWHDFVPELPYHDTCSAFR